jgi:hypothetical protein
MAMLITRLAHLTDRELDSDALGLVQILAWQDLTSQQSSTVGEDILVLGQGPNADFVLGCQDGVKLAKMFYDQDTELEAGDLNSDEWGASNAGADASRSCALSVWSQCFDSHVTPQEQSLS